MFSVAHITGKNGGIKMKLGFIGAGNMGSAIIKGVLNQQAFLADEIYLSRKHPEKSADVGLQLYKNFIHWNP